MILNIYRRTPNKPMIYSLVTARAFLEQSEEPFEIRIAPERWLIIHRDTVQIIHRQELSYFDIDTLLQDFTGKEAISLLYTFRKIINDYFRD